MARDAQSYRRSEFFQRAKAYDQKVARADRKHRWAMYCLLDKGRASLVPYTPGRPEARKAKPWWAMAR